MDSINYIGYIEKDNFRADEAIIIGGIKSNNIDIKNLTIIGYVHVKNLLLTHDLLIIGGGRIRELIGNNIIINSNEAPFFIDKLKAKQAYLLGGRHPIIVHDAFIFHSYLKHTLVSTMKSKKIIFSERSRIKILTDCNELYFIDPHTFIEELRCSPNRYVFKYETIKI